MNIEAFFKITYGLYIIATKNGDKLNGYIANTAFQVTAEPPQIAISCSKNNYTCQLIEKSKAFSISILDENTCADTIGLFGYQSGHDVNKFESVSYDFTPNGIPIITKDSIAWFDCKVTNMIDVGSHILFIATIEHNDILKPDASPLTYAYYHEVKKGRAPKNAPTYISDEAYDKKTQKGTNEATKHRCLACGYIYDPSIGDPDNGIAPGTLFEDLPEDWLCPTCGSPKEMFEPM